ncbi:MAG: HAMP domain-containing protein [Polyangiaceae bacterium]|nr:HAMP domain-containing protein [Polyangiaceae bacterium]
MKLGVRSKLFFMALVPLTLSVVPASVYLSSVLSADLTETVRSDLFVRLHFIEGAASSFGASLEDLGAWDRLAGDLGHRGEARVTIIRRDGIVLGDSKVSLSELEHLENHADRPEVVQASSEGQGSSMRWSKTIKRRLMYVALPFQRNGALAGFVRLAKPLTEVERALGRVRMLVSVSTVITLALATILVLLTSRRLSTSVRRLTLAARRMAAGHLEARTRASGRDELAELGRALDHLAAGLEDALGTLRKERDLLAGVLEGMREGVLLLDQQGRVALANTTLRATLLLGPEFVGRPLSELAHNPELEQLVGEAACASEPVSGELEIGDLQPRRLLVRAAALPSEPGGVLAVFVDVTELRRLETMRRDFVANASHELRTPVASVRSAAETLRRAIETQPEDAAEFVEMIERNAARLQQLIEDLLDLSRIESRQYQLDIEALRLDDVIAQSVAASQDRADAKGLHITLAVDPALPPVCADRRAFDQIVTNLVDNAVKYCPAGATVTLSAERAEGGLRVLVEDTGPGIAPEHLSRLFERFYRVDAGRSRALGGTGLGLSIVKHLVEAMHGQVSVESTPGKGSCFSFTLPLAKEIAA